MKNFLPVFLLLFFTLGISDTAFSQCKRVGLIGEFTGWSSDLFMDRDPENPELFTATLLLKEADDTSDPKDGKVELKFREDGDWSVNWGAADFPTGTAVANGANVQVPVGSYIVTFNCTTGAYTFTSTCGKVGIIGEFVGWADDHFMTRSESNPNEWSTTLGLTAAQDGNADGKIELKFRQNADWGVNWGAADFPTGVATGNGANIPVPVGTYRVTFNCSTGAYSFTSTCGEVGIIGEFVGWSADAFMHRDETNPDKWHYVLNLDPATDSNADGKIELKFRQNADWGVNWGAADFPTGTAVPNGANILVPLRTTPGVYTTYRVTFDCSTGVYNFQSTCGDVSMIGAFVNWNGDVPMNRTEGNANQWTLSRSWFADSEVKFRENKDWSVNWGNNTFPSGTATDNGPNIPLVAGKYNVSFNCATGAYNFTANNNICGEIGMIGDFNAFGDDGSGRPTDINMVRDAAHPSNFHMTYNFTSSTRLLFREDADATFTNVWGGTKFPTGTGVKDPSQFINVTGGTYNITFNCKSGDYHFERLGNSVIAKKVFTINVDGKPSEKDWNLDQNVSRIVQGEAGDDPNTVSFGVTYNDQYLFVAARVKDGSISAGASPELGDAVHFFVDGNKNGGDYDASDVHLTIFSNGLVIPVKGPANVGTAKWANTADGYTVEAQISWSALGVTPEQGKQIAFDFGVTDNDNNVPKSLMMWNGGLQNLDGTSSFGDLLFGELSCGDISIYSQNIGDINLRTPTDFPTTYVGTYQFDSNTSVVFRKDKDNTVAWGNAAFPTGIATIGGAGVAATTGRYRVTFNCLSGEYSFVSEPSGDGVALVQFASTPATVDGTLTEYNLQYGMTKGPFEGTGPSNNTVRWGASWDFANLYLGFEVIDAIVEGKGNPWENDAIEMYFDGNHDSDGTYDKDFDTQMIMDFFNGDVVWTKADGVPVPNVQGKFLKTTRGYNIELRIGWDNFRFEAARNRTMGFTCANNDSDKGTGRDYAMAWWGTANNWNNTGVHGDLQLAGGPLVDVNEPYFNEHVTLFPNAVNSEVFNLGSQLSIINMVGQVVRQQEMRFDGGNIQTISLGGLQAGTYMVSILSEDGKRAVKKIVVK
jgi:hypothetical protein